MLHRNTRRFTTAQRRIALGVAAASSCIALLPAAAQATPYQLVTCRGGLTVGTVTDLDSNPLNYDFHCSQDIQSYTVELNRGQGEFGTLDDFNVAPTVLDITQTTVSPTETVDCQATTTPGNSINCFAQAPVGQPQTVTAYNYIQGSIDSTVPFCGQVKDKKKGITAEPASVAQLIVTDVTGAEWGPFVLPLTPKCKPLPKPKPTSSTKKSSGKGKGGTSKSSGTGKSKGFK